MSRFPLIDPKTSTGRAQHLLEGVQSSRGLVPNITRAMANAPAALHGYLSFSAALSGGELNAKLREQIALTVAEANGCDYCLSAQHCHRQNGRVEPRRSGREPRGQFQ